MAEQTFEKKWVVRIVDWENGIPGGSKAPPSIEVSSFNHGIYAFDPAQPAQMQEAQVVFQVGPILGPLMQKCAAQKPFEKMVVELTHVKNKEQQFLLRYELFDVRVTNVNFGGSAHGDEMPYCSMSLNAKEIRITVTQPDGTSTTTLKP